MKVIIFFFTLLHLNVYGQKQNTVDSVVREICQTITNDKERDDSSRVENAVRIHLVNYIEDLPADKKEDFLMSVILRLQVKCKEFVKITVKSAPRSENWESIPEMPESKLSKEDCDAFFRVKNYKYVEPTEYTTHLKLDGNYWIDNLSDGTYSKLKLERKTSCDFELTFIESNNRFKSKLSVEGDKYSYRLIEKKPGYYLVCAGIPAIDQYFLFKVRY